MKSRVTNLIRLASVVSVAVGTLAGCGKTAVVEQPPIYSPCTSSGTGYYNPTPSTGCSNSGGSNYSGGGGYNSVPNQPLNVPTGSITGKILDAQTGLGLPGATVQVIGVTSVRGANGQSVNVTTITDAGGNYTLSNVPQGRQTMEVSKPDFIYLQTSGAVAVNVTAGATATVPTISLTPSRLTQANGFITAFSNFKHPRGIRLNKDGTSMYVVDVVGSGNIIWADWGEVKLLNSTGGLISTFGGISLTDLGSLSNLNNIVHWIKSPYGVGVDQGGNAFVADSGHNEIKQYGVGGKYVTSVKRNFKQVYDIAVMPNGNIVVTDPALGKIGMFSSSFGTIIDNLASTTNTPSYNPGYGTNPTNPTASPTPDPNAAAGLLSGGKFHGVAVDNGNNIYTVDAAGAPGMVVRKFDEHGQALSFAGAPGFGSIGGSQAGHFENPTGVAVDNRNGDIYVVDSGNNRVQRFDSDGRYLDYFGGFGTASGMFSTPIAAAVDKDGNVYVTDYNNGRVEKFGPGRPANGF